MAHDGAGYGKPAGRVEAPAGCAGYALLDPEGRKIGVVGEVFAGVAGGGGEPECARVKRERASSGSGRP